MLITCGNPLLQYGSNYALKPLGTKYEDNKELVKCCLQLGQSYIFPGKGVSPHEAKATSASLKATLLSQENGQVTKTTVPSCVRGSGAGCGRAVSLPATSMSVAITTAHAERARVTRLKKVSVTRSVQVGILSKLISTKASKPRAQ